jgi:hypothetical protein
MRPHAAPGTPPAAAPAAASAAGLPDPFPVARLRLRTRVERAVHWPEYAGSALRGLWGHALRRLACATGQPVCDGCPLHARCAYPPLFEPPPAPGDRHHADPTPPYVIEPGMQPRALAAGDAYAFDLVVFGAALAEVELVVRAWQAALARDIGPARGALRLEGVDAVDASGAAQAWLDLRPAAAPRPLPLAGVPLARAGDAPRRLRVRLLTPLYVKRGGRPLRPHELGAADFVWAVVRRVADVCELHLRQPTGFDYAALKAACAALRHADADLDGLELRRWSNRQQRHTPLAGIVGSLVVEGELTPFWPALQLGRWLHAGGKTSFGLGRYELETLA